MAYRVIPVTRLTEARTMHGAGWSYAAIGRTLDVHPVTVARWLDPEYNARQRVTNRIGHAQRAHEKPKVAPSDEFLIQRARTLRDAGMNLRCISVLYRVDYGLAYTEDQVKVAVAEGRWPRSRYARECEGCGSSFSAGVPQARWCSSRCRNRPRVAA